MSNPDILSILKTFFDYWQNVILASGVFVAIFVAYWTVKNDKTNLKLNGLNLAFKKLNNPEGRESRRKILSAYYDYLVDNDFPIEYTHEYFFQKHPTVDLIQLYPDLKEDVEVVKANFDEIGAMEKNGLLNKKAFFDGYYGSLLRCYGALHGNIIKSREKTGSKEYSSYFQQISEDAVQFWEKYYTKSTIKYHGQERNDFLFQRFEESGSWKIRIMHPELPIPKCLVYCDKIPLLSSKHNDELAHTIESNAGDNFITSKKPDDNSVIIVKSKGHTIKRAKFLDIEPSNP
jgi:hypothetical protein